MSSPEYYRRQAIASFNLARTAGNPETKRRLIELAQSYMMRSEAAAQKQLSAFVSKDGEATDRLERGCGASK